MTEQTTHDQATRRTDDAPDGAVRDDGMVDGTGGGPAHEALDGRTPAEKRAEQGSTTRCRRSTSTPRPGSRPASAGCSRRRPR